MRHVSFARAGSGSGDYGPYAISRFATGSRGRSTIYFMLSTWHRFITLQMEAQIVADGQKHPQGLTSAGAAPGLDSPRLSPNLSSRYCSVR
jgi:hypothetical protein